MPITLTLATDPPAGADLTVRIILADHEAHDLPAGAAVDAAEGPVLLYRDGARLALVGAKDDSAEALRTAAAEAAALARRLKARRVALWAPAGEGAAAALVEGFVLGGYHYGRYKTTDQDAAVEELVLVTKAPAGAHDAFVRAEAACYARDLVNTSPHDKTAPRLADEARRMASEVGLRCEVWNRARIEEERMGGLLAVNRGSVEPPRFVVLEHRPAGTDDRAPVVLVGKAVVFDTGGLSLKPTKGSMDQMKADMAGGAAVLGTMRALARLAVPQRVVALIPMSDNRPGGDAYVPGDVVTMRSGLTVEVLNTDAEGRMLLADALDVARQFEPRIVVDVATLTGAAVIALGSRVAAVCTPDDPHAATRLAAFDAAGRRSGEWVHPLPMHDHYAELLKSDVADLKNVGGREAGTISAAKFLQRFTTNAAGDPYYPWVHLDIAGPAFIDAPQPYRPAGGTGFGVRLLTDWLQHDA